MSSFFWNLPRYKCLKIFGSDRLLVLGNDCRFVKDIWLCICAAPRDCTDSFRPPVLNFWRLGPSWKKVGLLAALFSIIFWDTVMSVYFCHVMIILGLCVFSFKEKRLFNISQSGTPSNDIGSQGDSFDRSLDMSHFTALQSTLAKEKKAIVKKMNIAHCWWNVGRW